MKAKRPAIDEVSQIFLFNPLTQRGIRLHVRYYSVKGQAVCMRKYRRIFCFIVILPLMAVDCSQEYCNDKRVLKVTGKQMQLVIKDSYFYRECGGFFLS